MKIAIYSRVFQDENLPYLIKLIEALEPHTDTIFVHSNITNAFSTLLERQIIPFHNMEEVNSSVAYVISLGGDGTMLDAVAMLKEKQIPILGINFGRLGFLAGVSKFEIKKAVRALVSGDVIIDKKTLMHVETTPAIFKEAPFGLNDFTITKKDISAMIKIKTFLNGEYINTYWADGLIVSTPTGSTAYNMSCNGPILYPESSSFVLTPVAPHHLNSRPLVVPDNTVLSFEVETRNDNFICSLDARRVEVEKGTKIAIKKERFEASIVRTQKNSFLSSLKSKLGWGKDLRN